MKNDTPITSAIQDQVTKMLDAPAPEHGGQVQLSITKDGVQGQLETSIGKGWSAGAWGAWMKEKGYAFAGTLKGSWGRKNGPS